MAATASANEQFSVPIGGGGEELTAYGTRDEETQKQRESSTGLHFEYYDSRDKGTRGTADSYDSQAGGGGGGGGYALPNQFSTPGGGDAKAPKNALMLIGAA